MARYDRRALDDHDPYIQHMHRHVGLRGGAARLGAMYDDLLEVLRLCPGATTVPTGQSTRRLPTDARASTRSQPAATRAQMAAATPLSLKVACKTSSVPL